MRTYFWITVTAASLALLGCAEDASRKPAANNTRPGSNTTTNEAGGRTTVSKPAVGGGETPATSTTTRPDNTAVNQRDRDDKAVVPTDQGNNQQDLNVTADIRKRILQNKEMSTDAQNVKIITLGGKVTLRGPVASDAEKKIVEDIAKDVAGADKVTCELEVAP
jgi:hypothetical protein